MHNGEMAKIDVEHRSAAEPDAALASNAPPAAASAGASSDREFVGETVQKDALDEMVYEHMLLSRVALQGVEPVGRKALMERSAAVVLSRLRAQGPMTIAELSEAFDVDVSTVHRQIAAAMKRGLVERIDDPEGGTAKKHQPSPEGLALLKEEFEGRRESAAAVMEDWSEQDIAAYAAMLRRFNEAVERKRGKPWPR